MHEAIRPPRYLIGARTQAAPRRGSRRQDNDWHEQLGRHRGEMMAGPSYAMFMHAHIYILGITHRSTVIWDANNQKLQRSHSIEPYE